MNNKLYKIIILLIISLTISGCSIDYDFEIKNDNSVKEQAKIVFSSDTCYMDNENPYKNCKEYVEDMKKELTNHYGLVNYKTKVKEQEENTTVTFSHTYSNINDFLNSNSYKLFFMENESNSKSFNYSSFKVVQDYIEENELLSERINGFKITLKTNKKVTKCNANRTFQNTYMWNMDDMNNDSITFTLGKNEKQIVDKVIDDKRLKNRDTTNEQKNKDAFVIAAFITLIIALLIVALSYLLKLRRNNRV